MDNSIAPDPMGMWHELQGEMLGIMIALRGILMAHPAARETVAIEFERFRATGLASPVADDMLAGIDRAERRILPDGPFPD